MAGRPQVPSFEQVQESLARLDGTTAAAVSLLTGLSPEDLDALGGVTEPTAA